ncbi:hypothetical protein EAP59_27505 [Salmonella enterica]|nr:hypothetical protein [Salmonella enterica]
MPAFTVRIVFGCESAPADVLPALLLQRPVTASAVVANFIHLRRVAQCGAGGGVVCRCGCGCGCACGCGGQC